MIKPKKDVRTVVGQLVDECREAMMSGYPIVYIRTDSSELIDKVIKHEHPSIITLRKDNIDHLNRYGEEETNDFILGTPLTFRNKIKNGPHIFAYKINKTVLANGEINYQLISPITSPTGSNIRALIQYTEDYRNEKEQSIRGKYQNSLVILYSPEIAIDYPPYLKAFTKFIDVKLPDNDELYYLVLDLTKDKSDVFINVDSDESQKRYLSKICGSLKGFSNDEVSLIINKVLASDVLDKPDETLSIIQEMKKNKLFGKSILRLISDTDVEIGGMKSFQNWLNEQKAPLIDYVEYKDTLGIEPPKGVLLCGIPGCGKSLAAKYTAQKLGIPLISMDIGSLMNKYVGNSEKNMRDALALAESISPCVLWLDEIDKGFSGMKSQNDPHFKRMFGYLLTWMQDHEKPCFVFATANDIGQLPKEFFRSGRFDALFAAYLPTAEDCAKIFVASVKKTINNRSKGSISETINLGELRQIEESYYIDLINETFADSKNPRILIGSDINAIVKKALISMYKEYKKNNEYNVVEGFKRNLEKAAKSINVYGDNKENIQSIAGTYCRLLRKNFKPAYDNVLFESKNYDVSAFLKYQEFMETFNSRLSLCRNKDGMFDTKQSDELLKEKKDMADKIYPMGDSRKKQIEELGSYDKSVHNLLLQEIRSIAMDIEKKEHNEIVNG